MEHSLKTDNMKGHSWPSSVNTMSNPPVQRSPLNFFLLVYGLSIPLWLIGTSINAKGPLDFPITDMLAAFTPLMAASILVYNQEGRIGIKKLFRRIFDADRITKKSWYVPIIFLPFLLYLLIYLTIYVVGLPLAATFHISLSSIPGLFSPFFPRCGSRRNRLYGLCH